MDIEVTREALVRELALARRLGERKSTIPVYSHTLLDADFGEVRITATDGESALETGCSAKVNAAGRVLVPVKPLHEMARNASAETLRLSLDGARIAVACGAFRSKLGTLSVDDFPSRQDWPSAFASLPLAPLRSALEKTRFVVEAASAKQMQGYMNGGLLASADGKLTLVATDGRRLMVVGMPSAEAVAPVLLPRKALDDLGALLGAADDATDVGFAQANGRAFFQVGVRRFATQVMDATFPNYKRIIPENCANGADVDRDAWLGALRRVSLVSTETSRKVRLEMADGAITASLASQEIGDATETLPAKVTGGWATYFDAGYIADFLSAMDGGTVRFEQDGPTKGGKFTAAGDPKAAGAVECLYVCMPMSA